MPEWDDTSMDLWVRNRKNQNKSESKEPEPKEPELKDSGQRKEYHTGAVRDVNTDKGAYALLPPHALYRLARTLQKGAQKYDARNWEKGIETDRFMESALRHLFQYLEGYRDEDHLSQAAFNVMCLIETLHRIDQGRLPQALDTLPPGFAPNCSPPDEFVPPTSVPTEEDF